MKIAIVDYNMGNLASVKNGFMLLGHDVTVVSDADLLKKYDKLILPGVGAFGDAMEHLREYQLIDALKEYAQSGRYMLGICLGMQLLFETSQEFGAHDGLGLIEGDVVKFDTTKMDRELKIPHMGWNKIFPRQHQSLFKGMDESFYLYFVHSYHVQTDEKYVLGRSEYGYQFTSAVQKENILGIQPHPEKSHDNGLRILKNFIEL